VGTALVLLGLVAGAIFGVPLVKEPRGCGDSSGPRPPTPNALWFVGQPVAVSNGDVTFRVDRVERGQIVRPMVVHWNGTIHAWNRYEVRTEPSPTGFVSANCLYPTRTVGLVLPASKRVFFAATPAHDFGLMAAALAVIAGIVVLIVSTRRATRRHREIVRTHALP
jgi:hypothetical protein